MSSLTKAKADALAASTEYTREQVELIKATVAKGSSDDELRIFLQICKNTGLDPFVRQIYFAKRGGIGQTEATIDGFRIVAERTGEYRGQTGPYWCGADGKWGEVWLSTTPPSAAKVGVLREGFTEPVWGVATWEQYVPRYNNTVAAKWQQMGPHMLSLCAERLALRKAFPQKLSGVYGAEEMERARVEAPLERAATAFKGMVDRDSAITVEPEEEKQAGAEERHDDSGESGDSEAPALFSPPEVETCKKQGCNSQVMTYTAKSGRKYRQCHAANQDAARIFLDAKAAHADMDATKKVVNAKTSGHTFHFLDDPASTPEQE